MPECPNARIGNWELGMGHWALGMRNLAWTFSALLYTKAFSQSPKNVFVSFVGREI